jgi:hypothetical protein
MVSCAYKCARRSSEKPSLDYLFGVIDFWQIILNPYLAHRCVEAIGNVILFGAGIRQGLQCTQPGERWSNGALTALFQPARTTSHSVNNHYWALHLASETKAHGRRQSAPQSQQELQRQRESIKP